MAESSSDWSGLLAADSSADVCTDAQSQRVEAFERIERLARREYSGADLQLHLDQLRSFLEGAELEVALGIQTPPGGGHSIRRMLQYANRNRELRVALEVLTGSQIRSIERPWPAVQRLSLAVQRFGEERWPAVKDCESPPEELSPLDQALWRAFHASPREVPAGEKALAKICFPHLPMFRK